MQTKPLNPTPDFRAKVEALTIFVNFEQRQGYMARNNPGKTYDQLDADHQELVDRATKVKVHFGPKWVRVDVGDSGKYMIDADGNIVGIKGYGVPHRGHQFGTLDTIAEWDWSGYRAVRKQSVKS